MFDNLCDRKSFLKLLIYSKVNIQYRKRIYFSTYRTGKFIEQLYIRIFNFVIPVYIELPKRQNLRKYELRLLFMITKGKFVRENPYITENFG